VVHHGNQWRREVLFGGLGRGVCGAAALGVCGVVGGVYGTADGAFAGWGPDRGARKGYLESV
jgi:hypothetical protein